MPHEQDFPLYTTDPTTGELVPVENGQYLSQAEIERRRRARERAQQQAIRRAANDERTSAFGHFTFCRYISSAPFWANMLNADLVRRSTSLPICCMNAALYVTATAEH